MTTQPLAPPQQTAHWRVGHAIDGWLPHSQSTCKDASAFPLRSCGWLGRVVHTKVPAAAASASAARTASSRAAAAAAAAALSRASGARSCAAAAAPSCACRRPASTFGSVGLLGTISKSAFTLSVGGGCVDAWNQRPQPPRCMPPRCHATALLRHRAATPPRCHDHRDATPPRCHATALPNHRVATPLRCYAAALLHCCYAAPWHSSTTAS